MTAATCQDLRGGLCKRIISLLLILVIICWSCPEHEALPPLSRFSLWTIIELNVSEAQEESREEAEKEFHNIKPGNPAGKSQSFAFRRSLKGNCNIYDGVFKPIKSALSAGAVGGLHPRFILVNHAYDNSIHKRICLTVASLISSK